MVKETIVNIFLIVNKNNNIEFLKAKSHEVDGDDDEEKMNFLQNSVEDDLKTAEVFELPIIYKKINVENYKEVNVEEELKSIPYNNFKFCNINDRLFQEIYAKYGLPKKPLRVVTPIVDGKIRIDGIEER